MAGSNAVAAKAAIISRLQAAAGLTGVQVAWTFPGLSLMQRECVHGTRIRFDDEYLAFASPIVGAGRMPRLETATIGFAIWVRNVAGDAQAADTRAIQLSAAIEEAIAADPLLGGVAMCASIETGELESLIDDTGVATRMTLDIQVRSELD